MKHKRQRVACLQPQDSAEAPNHGLENENTGRKKARRPQTTKHDGRSSAPAAGSNWVTMHRQIGASCHTQKQPEGGTASEAPGERNTVLRRPEARGDSVELKGPVAIDCEMVGVGPEGKYSSLARVCIVNNLGNVLLDVYVKQKQKVADYRTFVSGIRPSDLKVALPLEEVQEKVHSIVKVNAGHSYTLLTAPSTVVLACRRWHSLLFEPVFILSNIPLTGLPTY
mmetsp:Transcript_6629/g.18495  ORF Transcript_6629/g.18495 Transcript_6629/m.18495 type:complete len:225 (-) Transcript_6629:689-1363(-)